MTAAWIEEVREPCDGQEKRTQKVYSAFLDDGRHLEVHLETTGPPNWACFNHSVPLIFGWT